MKTIGAFICLLLVVFATEERVRFNIEAASDLLIEYMPSPFLGVETSSPRFSWTLTSATKGVSQRAYRILVSTSSLVASGDAWDSGVVDSTQSHLVPYAGAELQAGTSYFWKVMWWDNNNNASPYSEVARFDVGLLAPSDWHGAAWVGGFNQLRTDFSVGGAVTSATASISGVGYYELWLNGNKVGPYVLDVSWTDYTKRAMYTTYDVTSMVKQGANAVGVMLGNGWWGQGMGGAKQMICVITIQSQGRADQYVISNSTWTGMDGPITADSIYNGETYDATKETPGWTSSGFNSAGWKAAQNLPGPGGALVATALPPIMIQEQFSAKKMTQPQKGVYVYDFGQNFSGWCKLSVKGPRGTTIRLRHAEILDHSGSGMIYTDNLRSAKATDYYTLKGDSNGEEYQPRFTYHGFRFVELTGFPGTPTLDTLEGQHLFSSVPSIGKLQLSNPILQQIQHNIIYGQQCNLMSVPTDCDQRDERLGWMGDAQLSAEEALHNFDMGSFYTHFVRLINDDEQGGQVTDTVPYLRYGARPADPAWGTAYPLIVWWLHQYKGDLAVVKEQYDGIKQWMDYLTGQVQGSGIANMFYHYGDWVPPPPAQRCNESLTSAFYYVLNLNQLSTMAQLLGNNADATKYQQLYNTYKTQFNSAFLRNGNTYAEGYQTCLVLPMFLGISPAPVLNTLLNDISSHQTHLTTGIIGTKYLPLVLSMYNRTDVALSLALQTTYPSWAYMFTQTIEAPATTLWELWDSPSEGPGMNSRNHIMFGSVGAWFYQYLAGIRQQEGTVGFTHPEISPPDANVLLKSPISEVEGTYKTPRGIIGSHWQRSGGVQCVAVYPTHDLKVACGTNGGIITKIELEETCRSLGSINAINQSQTLFNINKMCVGLDTCIYSDLYSQLTQETIDLPEQFVVKATCSAVESLSVQASIPVSTQALVHVNKLSLKEVTITENSNVVWQKGQFIGGEGLLSAHETSSEVLFMVGAGQYNFVVNGEQGKQICAAAKEGSTLSLSCPFGSSINFISFASYGIQSATCSVLSFSSSHAGCTQSVVEQMCVGKNSCQIDVRGELFGVKGAIEKSLVVDAICN